ncbi:MAG: GtrA family protein [Anaerolineales bacterium]
MTVILTNPVERTRFLKFAVVGVFGAVIDFGVANGLLALTHTTLTIAGTISFICAVISNFIWNRFWTYPESRTKPVLGQLVQFGLVNAAGLLIRIPILTFGEPLLSGWLSNFALSANIHQLISHNVTLAFAVGVVMMWNFFVNRYWTYNDVDTKS